MRINVSINMLFGIAACYSHESAPAMPTTSGSELFANGVATRCSTPNEFLPLAHMRTLPTQTGHFRR
jgi:hypothetical protein